MRHLTCTCLMALRAASAGFFLSAVLLGQPSLAAETGMPEVPARNVSAPLENVERAPTRAVKKRGASLRREAKRDWYGGEPTPDYRLFLMESAENERAGRNTKRPDRSIMASVAAVSAPPQWVNLGPTRAYLQWNGNVIPGAIDSGRVSAIVVHPTQPSIIYVATAGGGVWKTTTGGAGWAPITDGLGSLAVGALEMDPQDPNTLYLGLGDPYDPSAGLGFLRSSDGGTTWSALAFLQCQIGQTSHTATYIKQILASPVTPGLLLAATDVALFRSLDAGTTWSCVNDPTITNATPVWSIAWAGGGNFVISRPGTIHFSSDNGVTWARATGVQKNGGIERISLAAAPSNRNVMYALAAKGSSGGSDDYAFADIFRSVDGGRSWTALGADRIALTNPVSETSLLNLFGGQGYYNQLALVSPTDPNVAYFAGARYLVRTTDGGLTYTQLTDWLGQYGLPYVHADFHAGVFDNAGTFYVGGDGGIFKSGDAGHSWTSQLNIGIVSHLAYSIGSSLANPDAVIGGTQDDGTRVRVGASSVFNQPLGADGFGVNVHAVDPNLMLSSIYFSQIYRSNDAGATFFPASAGIQSSFYFFTKLVPALGDPSGDTLYTVTEQAAYKTTDYAHSWSPLGSVGLPPFPQFILRNIGASKSDPQVLGLVGTASQVYLSGNGGLTWYPAAPLPNSGHSLGSIWFDTTNSQIVYVTSVALNFGTNHIWRSVDGGGSWTPIGVAGSGFPFGIPVNVLVNDPTNPAKLYAGTLIGLYRSDDAGTTWARADGGLPLASVTDIYISPDATIKRVSTYGRGFWELLDGTESDFTIVPTSLPGGYVGSPYAPPALTAQGATCPCAYAVTSGSLPPGLTLSPFGYLGGIPTAVGSFSFIVTATDSTPPASGGPLVARQFYSISIAVKSGIAVSPLDVPNGTFGASYPTTILAATGARPPYSFAVSNGALPPGLALSSIGALSGTPTAPGTYPFTVTATDSTPAASGGPYYGYRSYAISVARAAQSISLGFLDTKFVGDADFAIEPRASSGGPVVLDSRTPATCTVSGTVVHIAAAGTCTISARQAGNTYYEPAEILQSFSILVRDVTLPSVVALNRDGPSPTMSDSLYWTLAFTEPVSGVTAGNFTVSATGISGAAVTDVGPTGNGAHWIVAVNSGRGNGELGLAFTGSAAITDQAGNPLAAISISGEPYRIDKGGTVIGTGQGTPDATFGNGGYALFDAGVFALAPEVMVLPEGRILAAGPGACDVDTGTCTLLFARYLAGGAPDVTFGQGGRSMTEVTGVVFISEPVTGGDGSFFIAGVRYDDASGYRPFASKFASSGAPSTSFGTDGLADLRSLPFSISAIGSTVDAAGRMLLAGMTSVAAGQGTDVFVARLTTAGALDPTFGDGGVARFAISTVGSRREGASDVWVLPDGRILVAGRTVGSTIGNLSLFDYLLLRLDANGALDPGFGAGGVVTLRFVDTTSSIGRKLAPLADGRILFIGQVNGAQCGIARLTASGTLDATFGTGGKALLSSMESCNSISLQPDGKLLLTGTNLDAGLLYAAYARLLPDGAIDSGFGTGGLVEISSYDAPGRAALSAGGRIVTSIVTEDPIDGLQKAWVVRLASQLASVTKTTIKEVEPGTTVTGQPYAVSVLVTSASGTPSGMVVITDDLGARCTIVALSAGAGSCALASNATGSRTLTATYGGSPDHRGSTGTRAHAVKQAETRTKLFTGANPVQVGTPVMMTASVTAIAPGKGVPTGAVTFSDGKTVLGTTTLDATGSATFVTSSLPAGTAKLVARYGSDANYKDSKSEVVEEIVKKRL